MTNITFKFFFKNIRKNAAFSVINIFGLTLGITSFLLIMLFVFSELSYDRYNEKADRIYRLGIRAKIGDTRINQTGSSSRMFREMSEKYPEIETGVKFLSWNNVLVKVGEKTFSEPAMTFVDSTVFNVFTFPMLLGDPASALARPGTAVLSETVAMKYFGNQNPVGKIIEIDTSGFGQFEITGVYKDIPSNSHFHFGLMASLTSFPRFLSEREWTANMFVSYFLLRPGASATELENKFKKYTIETIGEESYQREVAKGNFWEFFLQPLTSIHLHSDLNDEFEPNGNFSYVFTFIVIAFFVLIIACINFMNLSTARSMLRAKEVGIKKAAGSSRGRLISQFLLESVILTFCSLIIAIIIVRILLPVYSGWLEREISLGLTSSPWIIPGLLLFGGVVGVFAGLYPAFVLSSFSPVKVLKTHVIPEVKGIGLRSVLVIIQFAASILLIIGTVVITRQLNFIRNKDIGFIKENLLILRTPAHFASVREVFEQEMKQYPGIRELTSSNTLPGFPFSNWGFGAEGIDHGFTLNLMSCDDNFANVLGLQMAQGRFFSRDYPTDSSGIILNETAVRVLGLSNPIGTKMFDGGTPRGHYHVIGIVKDFNYESVHTEIRPMGLVNLNIRPGAYFTIRFEPGKSGEITNRVKLAWEKLMPGTPISCSYMEDDFNNLYRNEIRTQQVFSILALLAIIVAVVGLLGLASFMAQQRTREIAIRKVSGATAFQIIALLTGKFVRWVLVSFILASPIAWLLMKRWLEDFAFRVTLSPWVFVLSGAIAMALVIITVSLVIFRAARLNPAESMKYE